MKNTLARSFLLGACLLPAIAMAGGIEVIEIQEPALLRVDIPDLNPGWGFSVEGSALRGYNNNLNYLSVPYSIEVITATDDITNTLQDYQLIQPDYAFALRVGVEYTVADSGNIIKLYYEHLFDKEEDTKFDTLVPGATSTDNSFENDASASLLQKFDGASLVSEQHILIGPYWETTLTGGVRFAHVEQQLNILDIVSTMNAGPGPTPAPNFPEPGAISHITTTTQNFTMQFNGGGPLVGLGTIVHLTRWIAIGAEAQGTLLVGQNEITADFNSIANPLTGSFTINNVASDIDEVLSVVPEMYYRLYANLFHRFDDGSKLEIEAGWRANQFFNLRTFVGSSQNTLIPGQTLTQSIALDIVNSDDIGFSGPYLMINYHL